MRSSIRTYVCAAFLCIAATSVAQNTLSPADYGRWERLGAGVLSPDGRWLAVPVTRVDGTSELRIHAVENPGAPVVVEEGSDPRFSDDSKFLACVVGYPETVRRQKEKDSEPIRNKLGLVRLEDGKVGIIDNVELSAFSGDGAYVAYRKYPPDETEEESESSEKDEAETGTGKSSADLIVRRLADGIETLFGSVSEFAWQDAGSLLAFAIDAEDRSGNGVDLYQPRNGTLSVLESGDARFRGLSWREDDDDLAALRARSDHAHEEDTHVLLAWRDLETESAPYVYDHASDAAFPAGMRLTDTVPMWSDDGKTVFVGIREWPERVEESEEEDTAEDELEPSNVQVWHASDERIFPMQELQKDEDRKRSYLSAWHVDEGRFVRLGTDLHETVTPLEGQRFAVETLRESYRFDNQFDRPRHDVYLVDVASGARREVIAGTWYFEGGSATGRYLLYFDEGHYWIYDVDEDRRVNLTRDLPTSFVDEDYDTPVRSQRPPWGVAGWLSGDEAVVLYDKYDLWRVRPDGSGGDRLTAGESEKVRHRYVELDHEVEDDPIDPQEPIYLSLYGYWTKKFGYARLPVAGAPERLVWGDARYAGLEKAEDADVFAHTRQNFDDSPDYFAGTSALGEATQITSINTFESEYAWGRSELVEFHNDRGEPLQGALYYPAGYEAGKTYPMIVYIYEKRAQLVHDHVVPSERSPYNTAVFTQHGYFVLQPDIVYRDRDPGVSAVACVVPAVEAVLAKGLVDPERVGIVGHSWGGYEASYIPTRTDMFAASVAGAPLTNFFSMFGTIHWNQGYPESSHFETGQARMGVPYWDDMDAYVRNSPVMFIKDLNTPMLVFFGQSDGTVDWHQGVELYNYARRAGKNLVMLVYPGENHSARQPENQIDYHHRVLQWFGHYLKGEKAPNWMTRGVSALERERAMRRKH